MGNGEPNEGKEDQMQFHDVVWIALEKVDGSSGDLYLTRFKAAERRAMQATG